MSEVENPSGPAEAPVPVFDATLVAGCESVISAYRAGTIDKPDAILSLLDAIKFLSATDPADKAARKNTYRTYVGQLDEIDSHAYAARERGARAEPGPVEAPASGTPTAPGSSVREPNEETQEGQAEPEDEDPETFASSKKHNRDGSLKVPLDESLLPFMPNSQVAGKLIGGSPLATTIALKENYFRDVTMVKQRILCRPDCPEVPENIWPAVISNKFVDLDHIFSAIFSVDGDSKDTFLLGDVELSTKSSKPSKKIKQQGDWIASWSRYEDAVVYVYPHRARELREYSSYINDLFVGIRDDRAGQVILFDRAARSNVSRGNQKLLTDFYRFQHLQVMYLQSSGAAFESRSSRPESKRSRGRSNDICHRFNEGRCPNRDCNYRHVCRGCGSGSHAQTDCPGKASGSSDGRRK